MQSAFITFKSSRVHYSYAGTGDKILLCFHGYGESEQSFHFLENYLNTEFRIFAMDLPFHGETDWKEAMRFTKEDLLQIIWSLQASHFPKENNFYLLGFSMGGRIALTLLQCIPARIEKILLLAPDGLKINFWYWLATQTFIGNRLFAFTMEYAGWFFGLLWLADRLHLVNKSVYKFVQYYIHDRTLREQLYHRWTSMRKITPDLLLIKKIIHQYNIPVRLLYGRYDRVIRFERGEKFRKGMEDFCIIEIIDCGHQVLQKKNISYITQHLIM